MVVHGLAARVARAARAGDARGELAARQDLAAARAEAALHRILDNAPRLRVDQVARLSRVLAERSEPGTPQRQTFGARPEPVSPGDGED